MANCTSNRIPFRPCIAVRLLAGSIIFTTVVVTLLFFAELVQAAGSKPPTPNAAMTTKVKLLAMFPGVELNQPLGMLQAPADNANWFVLEKAGRLLRLYLADGRWRSQLILDLSVVVDSSSEGGLLGAAFHPQFAKNRQLFVSYTREGSADKVRMQSVLSRFKLKSPFQVVDIKSEKIILVTDQPYGNHNGGQIAFSPKGYLFYGLGDGGAADDPHRNGQNKNSLLGAMLRLDVNHQATYGIPADNPFSQSAASNGKARAEIYAWGLRNPWRWSFDRLNGELWLADVGQDDWEEVNKVVAGGNYGWNEMEGHHCFRSSSCNKANYQAPLLEYGHQKGRCSITGGYVYRGKQIKSLYGTYLYGDFCSGEIWGLAVDSVTKSTKQPPPALLLNTDMNISSFAEDNSGEIYVIDITGHIYKVSKPSP